MLSQIVHTSGSTVYFVFIILFYWMSRIPRANSGPGWWAAALRCASLARLLLLFSPPGDDFGATLFVYSVLLLAEKLLFLIGLRRFFHLDGDRPVWLAAGLAQSFVLISWLEGFEPWLFSIGLASFNIGALAYAAKIIFERRRDVPNNILLVAAASCSLLALHWATFPLIFFSPAWRVLGFVVGTVLVLVEYLSLLAAVFLLFQKRLLDAEEKALELAYQDPLTGLNNKRYMNMLFEKVLMLATRPHHLLAVIFIDLDNFKPINDTAGHRAGDEVLKTVARRIKEHTRSTDVCARVGGDEFVVIATQLMNEDQTHEVARKLLDQLTQEIPVGDTAYKLGASIGISLYPSHGKDLAELVEKADAAMYRVKHSGKSGYALYSAATTN